MQRHPVTLIALIALITLPALTGCGGGDGDGAATDATATTPAAPATNPPTTPPASTPDSTAPGSTIPDSTIAEPVDIAAFCAAKVAFDGVSSDTPDEESFDVYVAEATARAADVVSTAPPDLQQAAATVVSTLGRLDEGTAAHADVPYAEARAALARAVHERCGFGQLSIDIANNTYSSAPVEITDGMTSVLVDNTDPVVHVTIIARLAEGVSADQLLADPGLFETSATVVGVVVGGPKVADGTALALSAGNYVYFDPEHVEGGMTGAFSVQP